MPVDREYVACPICSRQIPEQDINLHLDLQCPGEATTSTSTSGVGKVSQTSLKSSPGREVIDILDTPPKPHASDSAGSSKGNVASIFASRNRVKLEEPSEPETGNAVNRPSLNNRKRPSSSTGRAEKEKEEAVTDKKPRISNSNTRAGKEKDTMTEKKVRVNPLTANQPLAERSRPATLERYIGQTDIVGPGSLLRARIEAGEGVGSCILWGPPGCGKTTLARLIAKTANADFKELSATSAGTADVRQVFEQAKNGLKLTGRMTILMIDEIHRFNKPQQDLFLPYVENGWVQLIGATTENPSFKVNGALLSRCQVFTLSSHTPESLLTILQNSLENIPSPRPRLPPDLLPFLADVADGDARQALNGLELALKVCQAPQQTHLDPESGMTRDIDSAEQERMDQELMEAVKKGLRKGYDRSGEERYDMISALHKCLRGSDGSAAMYWLARMLTGGEDPLYIARRLVVMSSEDIGLADPHALPLATATYQACQTIGMPECRINLAHCVAYLAEAPKSTRSYNAYKRAEAMATTTPLPGVPLQIRNAPTKLMKTLGYGKHYSYDPDYAHPVYNEYLPAGLSANSSLSNTPDQHFLKTPEAEAREKKWDEERLREWESEVNNRSRWEGRSSR